MFHCILNLYILSGDFEQYKDKFIKLIVEKKKDYFLFDKFLDVISRKLSNLGYQNIQSERNSLVLVSKKDYLLICAH